MILWSDFTRAARLQLLLVWLLSNTCIFLLLYRVCGATVAFIGVHHAMFCLPSPLMVLSSLSSCCARPMSHWFLFDQFLCWFFRLVFVGYELCLDIITQCRACFARCCVIFFRRSFFYYHACLPSSATRRRTCMTAGRSLPYLRICSLSCD